jgi:hypothetical protein
LKKKDQNKLKSEKILKDMYRSGEIECPRLKSRILNNKSPNSHLPQGEALKTAIQNKVPKVALDSMWNFWMK